MIATFFIIVQNINISENIVSLSDKTEIKQSCDPIQKLAFAKTHKTGGSTLQNIFLRYGYKYGLKFALPIKSWIFSLDKHIDREMVTQYSWNPSQTFDIMA